MLQNCTHSYISTAWHGGTETFKALKAFLLSFMAPHRKSLFPENTCELVWVVSGWRLRCNSRQGTTTSYYTFSGSFSAFAVNHRSLRWVMQSISLPAQDCSQPRTSNPHVSLGRQWFRLITLLFTLCILRTALKTWKHSCVLIRKGCCSQMLQELFNPPHHCSVMSGCRMYHTCFLDSSGLISNAEACTELAEKSKKASQGVQEACVSAGHIQHLPLLWKAMCCQNSLFSVSGPIREQRQEQRPSFISTHTQASRRSSHYSPNACLQVSVRANSLRPSL